MKISTILFCYNNYYNNNNDVRIISNWLEFLVFFAIHHKQMPGFSHSKQRPSRKVKRDMIIAVVTVKLELDI